MAATGIATIGGIGRASAQEATPCVVSFSAGTIEDRKPNYRATADRADFIFLVRMAALPEEVVLVSAEQGGEFKEGVAAFKATVTREGNGPLRMEKLHIQWPLTAIRHEGQLYNVIRVAHDNRTPVGIVLSAAGQELGDIIFEPGSFNPDQEVFDFNSEVSALIHDKMMERYGFSIRLVAAGNIYSMVQPDTAEYERFLLETLIPAMDEARRQDVESGCASYSSEEMEAYLDAMEDCFLTSACCAVIGLDDRCWELETLRRFRDGWLSSFAAGRADIARYYREAPAVAQRLVSSATGRRQLLALYWRYIVPSALLAKAGANRLAYRLYRRMMLDLLGRPA
jgi:hypothetical protein